MSQAVNSDQKKRDRSNSVTRIGSANENDLGHTDRSIRTSFFKPAYQNDTNITNMVQTQSKNYRQNNGPEFNLTPTYDITDKYLNNMYTSKPVNLKTINSDQYEAYQGRNNSYNKNHNTNELHSRKLRYTEERSYASPNIDTRRDSATKHNYFMKPDKRTSTPPKILDIKLKSDKNDHVAMPRNMNSMINNMASPNFYKANDKSFHGSNKNHVQKKESILQNYNTGN